MICKQHLIKSIQYAHTAIAAYSQCICDECSDEERQIFQDFALELSKQVRELRKMSIQLYNVDPLNQYISN